MSSSIIFSSDECWKIEKQELEHNLHCYAFTCPCLFNVRFSSDIYTSGVLFEKLLHFDKVLSKKSLWVVYRTDINYHATLLSEEVMSNETEKIDKYLDSLNVERKVFTERHVHIFSRIFDSSTNQPLPRSLTPLLLSYFGDVNSANAKCIYLASIYNTLLENTAINNNMITQPSFFKPIDVNYIVPEIPKLKINAYKHFFIMTILLVCMAYVFVMHRLKHFNSVQHSSYSLLGLLLIVVILYYLYKYVVVKTLVWKATDSISKYTEYHHNCHESCKKMFANDMKFDWNNQILLLKDLDENKFKLSDYKNTNKTQISNAIEYVKNFCNFNCGNNAIVLTLNIFNDEPYNNTPFSTTSLLDGLSHLYHLSPQSEADKTEFYNNVTRYFQISVL